MFRLLTLIFALVTIISHAHADCSIKINRDVLGASYKVTSKGGSGKTSRNIMLWRNGKQVAHEYTDTHITEIWEQMSNGMLRMERHFDEYKRGIEYDPFEINKGKGERDWSMKYRLISDDLMSRMQLKKTKGKGCDKIEKYELKEDGLKVKLEWLPEKQLVKSYSEESGNSKIRWELEDVIPEAERVKKMFLAHSDFHTTDYSDIGDNESDPFLLKMINLGHVEHGASGFYDADGHLIEDGRHQH